MQTRFISLKFFAAVVAATVAVSLAVPASGLAATAADKCAQAVAKSMSNCIKKGASAHAGCYKKTGQRCPDFDSKLIDNYTKAQLGIQKKCTDPATIAAAGYGTFSSTAFGQHFTATCKLQSEAVAARTFGLLGQTWAGADEAGQKCLLAAAKESGKYLATAIKNLGKCPGACDMAAIDTKNAEAAVKAVDKIDGKCSDLAALVGSDSTAFVAVATNQAPSAVAAPCDPTDQTRCVFPFPNDYYAIPGAGTASGMRLALGPNALPRNDNNQAMDSSPWNTADGFSIGPMLLFGNEDADLDMTGTAPITDLAASQLSDTPIVLVDAETGEQQLIWIERDANGATAADQPIIGYIARNLKNSHRYIVAVRGLKDSGGGTLAASDTFAIYRDQTPTDILPIEARRAHMEDIFDTLDGFGIARNELYLAWDFTTQSTDSTAGRLLKMRDESFDTLGSNAGAFTVTNVTEPLDGDIFRQVDGTFEVPLYLTLDGEPGTTLRTDIYGQPVEQGGTFTAAFRCLIPYAATTAGGAPAVPGRPAIYGHGLLGSHTEVGAGNVRDFSSEHNFVQCATDWTGFAEDDVATVFTILSNFTNFPKFIDRQHQGILNQLFLARLMIAPNGFATDPAFQVGGDSVIDASEMFYDGNSQGGILGHVVAAVAQDITRFSLGVPGINYSLLLNRSTDFIDFNAALSGNYPSSTDRNLLLAVGQILWDRTDPNGHVTHVTGDTYADTPAKKLLMQVAFGDHQVAPVSAEIAARSNGASIHTPTLQGSKVVPEVTPYYDIPAIQSYPFDGSALVIWDSGNPAPPITNTPPTVITPMDSEWSDLLFCPQQHESDPHSCPRRQPEARQQKSDFLTTGGAVTDQCSGAACLAPAN